MKKFSLVFLALFAITLTAQAGPIEIVGTSKYSVDQSPEKVAHLITFVDGVYSKCFNESSGNSSELVDSKVEALIDAGFHLKSVTDTDWFSGVAANYGNFDIIEFEYTNGKTSTYRCQ